MPTIHCAHRPNPETAAASVKARAAVAQEAGVKEAERRVHPAERGGKAAAKGRGRGAARRRSPRQGGAKAPKGRGARLQAVQAKGATGRRRHGRPRRGQAGAAPARRRYAGCTAALAAVARIAHAHLTTAPPSLAPPSQSTADRAIGALAAPRASCPSPSRHRRKRTATRRSGSCSPWTTRPGWLPWPR